ncbi:uncharacterized protein PV09_09770 [Verruconis gallopava]|uniref:Uncharacterized protein n=1 Tax=Verruconis gallopava TaxID=253628 RepID=A0A0D1ZV67_9PEZI|nr:uncharacterized protein PV09_09770 [Verruconis gallopava]KIV98397.1 hypothetical protein PV09_09770 [Verruconis gallopava]
MYKGLRFDPSRDNLLSQQDDKLHSELRSKLSAGYSGREVDELESKIDENILKFVNLIKTYADSELPMDMGRKVAFFSLDTISHLAFGEPLGDLSSDSDVYGYIDELEKSLPFIILTTAIPWIMTLMKLPFFSSLTPNARDTKGLGKAVGIAKEVTKGRFSEDGIIRRDMLGSFIARGLTQLEAESELVLQLIAGSDTTATAIRMTLLHVITNYRVLGTLLAEIDAKKPTWPVITDEEARKMPYLQAVIKEGLRIWPPLASLESKEVPKGGDTFGELFLPEGTCIGVCIWGIMRRADVWGKNAAEFRPERWLSCDPQQLKVMTATLNLVFHTGKWQCLGKNVALMELNKVFVELLRRFEFVIIDPSKPMKSSNRSIFLQSEFWLRAYCRPSAQALI